MKYIDADRLRVAVNNRLQENADKALVFGVAFAGRTAEDNEIINLIDSLQKEQIDMGEVSDGYHTFNELYYYRMLYNAAFFNLLPKEWVHKSKRHHTGEECFGGGWFIVMANLPTGQISNHYELKDWDLFQIPEKEIADEWDGHTPQEAAERIHEYLLEKQKEQKPAEWSEEDESFLDSIEESIHSYYDLNHAPQYDYWLEEKLKSLRSSWKPSEEQMKEYSYWYRNFIESGLASPTSKAVTVLGELLEQLKKLM